MVCAGLPTVTGRAVVPPAVTTALRFETLGPTPITYVGMVTATAATSFATFVDSAWDCVPFVMPHP